MAAWQEPEFEPVSPDVVGSNPVRYNFRVHEAPWQSEESDPPHKRMKFSDPNHGFPDPNHTFQAPSFATVGSSMATHDPNHGFQPPSFPSGGGSVAPHVSWANRPSGANNNLLQKTKLCTRFVAGTCTYNDNCNFAHGLEELRRPPSQLQRGSNQGLVVRPHKTRPCKFFREGNCPYGERCTFLHAEEGQQQQQQQHWQGQMRPVGFIGGGGVRASNWKTKLCVNWEGGQHCSFGDKCNFAHGLAELQKHGGGGFRAESGIGVQVNITPKDNFNAPYSDSTRFGYISTSLYGSEGNIQKGGFQSSETSIPAVPSYFIDNVHQEAKTLAYQNPQDNAISQYNGYTSPTNEWENFNAGVTSEPNNSQMYGQATQQQPWVAHSETNNLNSQREDEPGSADYFQNQQCQETNVPFFRVSTRHDYPAEMISGFRQYANSDSIPSRNGNVNLHTGHGYSEDSGYADQDNGPYY